ncbi:NAD(P)-binding Rossmann-fold containing protein [Glarea lozoyensis ATCC 20868]|uniref:NAD(P)-binding Rossmann-fold containing protein n=1 Tax=Glarea lozoyensis (strain ATCC 20868 / MF5171) TaxID=1116229 RepID=S3DH50_GLAL2|nr:NAD(P)-binding Rossmann-fold containing protein [Glarea lozoyensis ATCC 20868]EPE25898.1 NAD(P)-binding Rossmann-fold containing protein [Glarea lozoyensis ATCC 20868]
MKVLLLGATGNLGSRILPALLAHNHEVTAFVRNREKLQLLVPASIIANINVVQGDVTSRNDVADALCNFRIQALINAAGAAPMMPWNSSQAPQIEEAIVHALKDVGLEQRIKIRSWFVGGMLLLDVPYASQYTLYDYLPLYREDVHKLSLLESSKHLTWSCLCPGNMTPRSKAVSEVKDHVEKQRELKGLLASISVPAGWKTSILRKMPLCGGYLDVFSNLLSLRNSVHFEDVAEFIAGELENPNQLYIRKKIGLIEDGAARVET